MIKKFFKEFHHAVKMMIKEFNKAALDMQEVDDVRILLGVTPVPVEIKNAISRHGSYFQDHYLKGISIDTILKSLDLADNLFNIKPLILDEDMGHGELVCYYCYVLKTVKQLENENG